MANSPCLLDDEIRTGGKGDFPFVPRNTPHAFRIYSETASFLNGYTPAGMELAVMECALPAPRRTIPPSGATPPLSMTDEQYRRYGMDNLPGPNPLAIERVNTATAALGLIGQTFAARQR